MEKEYQEVLAGVKSDSSKVKQLASMIIPKYYKSFPALQGLALNALLDLCEDDELPVCCGSFSFDYFALTRIWVDSNLRNPSAPGLVPRES
jgi:hypothetical protein